MGNGEDLHFQISFYESVLRRDRSCVEVIELLGDLYTKTGRIADGLKMDRKLVRLQPDNPMAHYNLACSLALSDRKQEALKTLGVAIDLGYEDHKWMLKDPDLKCLHALPNFKQLLVRIRDVG